MIGSLLNLIYSLLLNSQGLSKLNKIPPLVRDRGSLPVTPPYIHEYFKHYPYDKNVIQPPI